MLLTDFWVIMSSCLCCLQIFELLWHLFLCCLQIFELLWRLVCHDVCFVWERAEYLQQDDLDILTEVPFKVRNYIIQSQIIINSLVSSFHVI